MIPTMIAAIFIVFSILAFIPGDPGRMILGIAAPQEAVDMFNHNLGLDRPFIVRFLDYATGIFLRFDFGDSYRNNIPVIDEIMLRFPTTFRLAILGVISVVVLGVPLGILAAIRRSTITDAGITLPEHFRVEIDFHDHKIAARKSFYPGMKRESAKVLSFETDDWYEVCRMLVFVVL